MRFLDGGVLGLRPRERRGLGMLLGLGACLGCLAMATLRFGARDGGGFRLPVQVDATAQRGERLRFDLVVGGARLCALGFSALQRLCEEAGGLTRGRALAAHARGVLQPIE